jgi:hypothetical protein
VFEGTDLDNFDASVASFAEGISDFSGLSEQDVQTYNGYFTKERSDEGPVKEIKPFENYFEVSNSPTQQSSDDFFDSKQDNIRYYDEEGNLIDPDKLKSIDYQPDFFEFPEIDINRRVFETNDNSKNIDWKQKKGVFETNDNSKNIDWKQKKGVFETNDNSNNIDWQQKNGPSRRQENIYGALENINRPKRRNQSKRKSTSSSSLPPSVASPLPVSISTKSATSTPKLFVRTTTAGYNNLRYKEIKTPGEDTYNAVSPLPSQAVTGFTSFDKGPSFSFPDFEIDDLIAIGDIESFFNENFFKKVPAQERKIDHRHNAE